MICDLCKREFTEREGRTTCSSCGFAKGCGGVRCPYCYYEIVPRPKWLEQFFAFFGGPHPKETAEVTSVSDQRVDTFPLTMLAVDRRAWVDHLDMAYRHKLEELIAMGVLPGKEIELIQKFPSFVFQMGFSQFSIDRELASCIHVRPIGVK